MKADNILVTGGCGYIGSHVTCQLSESGRKVIVVDDLSTGHKSALLHNELLYVGNCGDSEFLSQIFKNHPISTVYHFAGSIIVPESILDPWKYYQNNVSNTLNLIRSSTKHGVKNFILSSSAAVYGDCHENLICENAKTEPVHPYGRSKLMDEWMLNDIAAATEEFKYVAIRYFNVAGADLDFRIGQSSKVSTHLIKVACEVAVGLRDQLNIYGADYQNPDGTCIRDYVHVVDLARAHIEALKYLENGGKSLKINCGYNKGYSVLEVINSLEEIVGKKLNKTMTSRRPGDVAKLVANAEKIKQVFDWKPQFNSLNKIISSSLQWEMKLHMKKSQHT